MGSITIAYYLSDVEELLYHCMVHQLVTRIFINLEAVSRQAWRPDEFFDSAKPESILMLISWM